MPSFRLRVVKCRRESSPHFRALVSSFAQTAFPTSPPSEQRRALQQNPLAGYVINGSTSESVLLTWPEVYREWEIALDKSSPSKELIAGTGAESTIETIAHTNHASHRLPSCPRPHAQLL